MGDASADTAKVPESETEEVSDADDAMGDASADTAKTPDADDV